MTQKFFMKTSMSPFGVSASGRKKSSTIFLQVIIVLFGVGLIVAMLWEPHLEGRNVNATLFDIYFKDPFLAYAYIGTIPFFVALYKAFKVLGYAGQNNIFSQKTINALRTIKYGVLITAAAIVGADIYLKIAARGSGDDPAGAIALGIIATFVCIVIATAASVFERTVQNGVKIKSENDLTV